MGIFDDLKKALSGDSDIVPKQASPQKEVAVREKKNVKPMARNDKDDFQLLVSLFQKHKTGQNVDIEPLVRKINPNATPHKCPYCGVVHEFTASRARKCPACSKKMVV